MNLSFTSFNKKNYDDYLRLYSPYFIELDAIHNKKYRNEISKTGFMVGKPYELHEMKDAKIHLCAKNKNEVIGIIRGDKIIIEEQGEKESLTWKASTQIKNKYLNGNGIELGCILVALDNVHIGVGSMLLKQFVQACKDKNIKNVFSWVVSSPKNIPSLTFHKKHTFTHVATFKSQDAWGIPNYESYLFYLRIK